MIRPREASSLSNSANYGRQTRLISRRTCIGLSCSAHHKLLQLGGPSPCYTMGPEPLRRPTRTESNHRAVPLCRFHAGHHRATNRPETLRNLSSDIAKTSDSDLRRDVSGRKCIRFPHPSCPRSIALLLSARPRAATTSPRASPFRSSFVAPFFALPRRQDRDREIFETRLRSRAPVRIRITISCLELLRSRFQRSSHEIEKFQFNRARFKPRFFRYRNVDGRPDNTADVVRGRGGNSFDVFQFPMGRASVPNVSAR